MPDDDEEDEPLHYWKSNSHCFKLLCKIVKLVIGIIASSGDIEHMFSTASDILSAKRNHLKPDFFKHYCSSQRSVKCIYLSNSI